MMIITAKDKADAHRCIERVWARHDMTTNQWARVGQMINGVPVGTVVRPCPRCRLGPTPEPVRITRPGPYERLVLGNG